jgi:Fe-S-cluster containining protein
MPLQSDHNGVFIRGLTGPEDLRDYLQRRYTQAEIQNAYVFRIEEAKRIAREEGIPPLTAFWRLLDNAYAAKYADLKCQRGCGHCCHTGVMATQLEWDGIVAVARERGIDLNRIIERARRTVERVESLLETQKNLDQVNWHRAVINQPCPFLNEDQACDVYEHRPLDCRLVVAFRDACTSKNLEHAQRGVTVDEAVAATVIARLQHDQTPKMKQRKFNGTQKLRLLQHWLILWRNKSKRH